MANSSKFPELNLCPGKLKLSYTLSKSTNSTKSKQPSTHIPDPDSFTNRISLSPKKSSRKTLQSKIDELEEDLDISEISLKTSRVQNVPNRYLAELEIYKSYIQSVISKSAQVNPALSRCLDRGWKGYQRSLSFLQPSQNSIDSGFQSRGTTISLNKETQVNEESLNNKNIEDLDLYINSLHKAVKDLNKIHINELIEKLKELSTNLNPVDVPSLNSTPDLSEPNLQETFKKFHSKIQSKFQLPENKSLKKKTEFKEQETQTKMSFEDLRIIDSYASKISEKEYMISNLKKFHSQQKEEIEGKLRSKNEEIDGLKRDLLRLKAEECPSCALKKKQIETYHAQLRDLKMASNKDQGKELKEVKQKLLEYIDLISNNQETIKDLKKNLEDLTASYEQAKAQREKLQQLLAQEESLRKSLESKLKNENHNPKLINPAKLSSQLSPSTPSRRGFSKTNMQVSIKTSGKSPDKKHKFFPSALKQDEEASGLVNGFREYANEEASVLVNGFGVCTNEEEIISNHLMKKSKKQAIMGLLGMTKEEYLALSKKTRLDIYVVLSQHSKKCTTDCEHLRRAMMLRYKDRGTLYPTKKYNIS